MTILVTGATGNVGRQVVHQLIARDARVRAMTRNPAKAALPSGIEMVKGHLRDPDTLGTAFAGVDRVFLFPFEGEVERVMEIMRDAGICRVVVLSSMEVDDQAEDDGSDFQQTVERAVERSGFDWTHLRPCGFMANALDWAESIKAHGIVRAPYGRSAHPYIHEADIAAVGVEALLKDGHAGSKYNLTGPEPISQIEQVRAIGRAIEREIRFEELSPGQAREEWRSGDWSSSMAHEEFEELADWLLEILASGVDTPRQPLPTVDQITGRPPLTFDRWASDHAADFL
ncbi:NAD(P)H-binding protein [Sphingosinicella sp. LHD-64]|uniref:NAD(P)H-binding protein n=1 Tax=Sphingosinicella sp. LHD-64 TaxID=3072139 RepID=UPI00280F0BE4|nr:NAD(P)H-binding protein [Sphingosinicella sp. LHD-64]MDQ8757312.1 NAD(P)H-binding protein [Sphingosinicella sp. LHD-64]